jgi:hypothetical protein
MAAGFEVDGWIYDGQSKKPEKSQPTDQPIWYSVRFTQITWLLLGGRKPLSSLLLAFLQFICNNCLLLWLSGGL